LWALSTNTPSIKACMKGGFKPVCEAAHVSCSIRSKRKTASTSRLSPKDAKLDKSLLQSPYLRKMNGYFAYKWYFTRASRRLLERLLRQGELFGDEESVFILTKPTMSFGVPYSSFTVLHGSTVSSLRIIKRTAAIFGRVWLGGYLPYTPYMLKKAQEIGFKRDRWGYHCIVFEKNI